MYASAASHQISFLNIAFFIILIVSSIMIILLICIVYNLFDKSQAKNPKNPKNFGQFFEFGSIIMSNLDHNFVLVVCHLNCLFLHVKYKTFSTKVKQKIPKIPKILASFLA